MAVAVAALSPARIPGAVLGAAHRVSLRRQQGVHKAGHQLPQQVRAAWASSSCKKQAGSILGSDGHRVAPFESAVEDSLERSPVTVTYICSDTVRNSQDLWMGVSHAAC